MPPKAKYTREEIIEIGFQMAREQGIDAVVARELGKKLGTSSSPIFTAFKNMEELQIEIRNKAMKEFESYVKDALNYTPAFKHVGIKLIQFAVEEPNLFRLLYMREYEASQSFEEMVGWLGDTVTVCVEVIENDYGLTNEEAKRLFRQVWLYTFGISALLANKVCHFKPEEISEMLSHEFQGALMLIKSKGFKTIPVTEKDNN
ncbi:MAG: TetR/AcrR family transcriptional regulator [Lachnospiraceae bacterium]|nr:TetR/AcrR family transcriptional regulator [Lachnospiraceae bacterium]